MHYLTKNICLKYILKAGIRLLEPLIWEMLDIIGGGGGQQNYGRKEQGSQNIIYCTSLFDKRKPTARKIKYRFLK